MLYIKIIYIHGCIDTCTLCGFPNKFLVLPCMAATIVCVWVKHINGQKDNRDTANVSVYSHISGRVKNHILTKVLSM